MIMSTDSEGFVDGNGVFRSYQETVKAAKKKTRVANKTGKVLPSWIETVASLHPVKDREQLKIIIAEQQKIKPGIPPGFVPPELVKSENKGESEETPGSVLVEDVAGDDLDADYPIVYYGRGPRNWGSGAAWFAAVYTFLSLTVLGTLFFVFHLLAAYHIEFSFTSIGGKLFYGLSALGFVSVVLAGVGWFNAKKDGFSRRASVIGFGVSCGVFVAGFVLFNLVFPQLTYPGL